MTDEQKKMEDEMMAKANKKFVNMNDGKEPQYMWGRRQCVFSHECGNEVQPTKKTEKKWLYLWCHHFGCFHILATAAIALNM